MLSKLERKKKLVKERVWKDEILKGSKHVRNLSKYIATTS